MYASAHTVRPLFAVFFPHRCSTCSLFVLYLSSICFSSVPPLASYLFTACSPFVIFARSFARHLSLPFPFCILYTLYFIHFSFALHSSLVRYTLVRNLSPTCSPFVSLGFRLFPICFPLAFSIRSVFIYSSSVYSPYARRLFSICFLFSPSPS